MIKKEWGLGRKEEKRVSSAIVARSCIETAVRVLSVGLSIPDILFHVNHYRLFLIKKGDFRNCDMKR